MASTSRQSKPFWFSDEALRSGITFREEDDLENGKQYLKLTIQCILKNHEGDSNAGAYCDYYFSDYLLVGDCLFGNVFFGYVIKTLSVVV
jgi:hypothetical protein